jgi:hypothetical protein
MAHKARRRSPSTQKARRGNTKAQQHMPTKNEKLFGGHNVAKHIKFRYLPKITKSKSKSKSKKE